MTGWVDGEPSAEADGNRWKVLGGVFYTVGDCVAYCAIVDHVVTLCSMLA